MNTDIGPHQVVDLTPAQRAWLNILELPRPKRQMYGLLEVDVTVIRQFIAQHKARTGETLSFTGYLTLCLARAVDEEKSVQAYRKGRGQLVMFDEVDIGLMVERQSGEEKILSGYVVRDASHKTYREIHEEIRLAQQAEAPSDTPREKRFMSAISLPWPLSKIFIGLFSSAVRRDPTIPVSLAGAVGITAVGMFGGDHSGWGLYPTRHSLDLVVGSIVWKPAVVDGRIEPREILHLTVAFDHDVVDGAPAARFTRRLVELIECGYGLVTERWPGERASA